MSKEALQNQEGFFQRIKSISQDFTELLGERRDVVSVVHQLEVRNYFVQTYCDYCNEPLFGLTQQGLHCIECNKNYHKACVYRFRNHCYGLPGVGYVMLCGVILCYVMLYYIVFEKKHGDRAGIEDVLVSKRRTQYEKEVTNNPLNYDAWFDYVRLEESSGDQDKIREIYERAIANLPPSQEKRLWRRYIYLWTYYTIYEELTAGDIDRTRSIYKAVLNVIPHKKFTFAEIWLMYARFELRQKNLIGARKILGQALGICPKDKIFKGYIELEMQLREFDRCRTLYEKFLEYNPSNCTTWIKFAELETALGDTERARALYELAVDQSVLDMPEILWKSYIDFETEQEEYELTRQLYRRLLERSQHVKIWISFARFESAVPHEKAVARARQVYEQADKTMAEHELKEERVMILEAWKEFEELNGNPDWVSQVAKKMPKKVKKRRLIDEEVG
eukprot:Ihof_evm2s545 gene=Ihof_evmTU2s545